MKLSDFNTTELELKTLKLQDLENFFNIYTDKHQNYFYNLNATLGFDIQTTSLPEYQLTHDMHWPLISYKIYKHTRYAWLLMKLNNVSAKDVFKIRRAGEKIKYLDAQYANTIVVQFGDETR